MAAGTSFFSPGLLSGLSELLEAPVSTREAKKKSLMMFISTTCENTNHPKRLESDPSFLFWPQAINTIAHLKVYVSLHCRSRVNWHHALISWERHSERTYIIQTANHTHEIFLTREQIHTHTNPHTHRGGRPTGSQQLSDIRQHHDGDPSRMQEHNSRDVLTPIDESR